MPFGVLVVLCVLGYTGMGVLLASTVAYVSNRYSKDRHGGDNPLDHDDAVHLAFFSVFWPVSTVLFGMVGLGFGLFKLVKKTSGVVNGYVVYLMRLGRKDEMISS
jgi:hypothetical protein